MPVGKVICVLVLRQRFTSNMKMVSSVIFDVRIFSAFSTI